MRRLAILLLLLAVAAAEEPVRLEIAAADLPRASDSWYGIYSGEKKIGWAKERAGLEEDGALISTWDMEMKLLAAGRTRHQLHLIPKRAAMKGMAAALARGECVAILLDQDAGRHGTLVPFFGQPASTSRSLAVLAMKTGAPVVPVSIRRLPDGEHQITIEPAIPLIRSGQLDRDVELNTARFTEAIERQIHADPRQWFWVHRRWKSVPA